MHTNAVSCWSQWLQDIEDLQGHIRRLVAVHVPNVEALWGSPLSPCGSQMPVPGDDWWVPAVPTNRGLFAENQARKNMVPSKKQVLIGFATLPSKIMAAPTISVVSFPELLDFWCVRGSCHGFQDSRKCSLNTLAQVACR